MNGMRVWLAGVALSGAALAQTNPPGSLPEPPAASVQGAGANDPAVADGLSSERVVAQARYLFQELDTAGRGELMPRDVPAELALRRQFLAFDIDGDGRIGLAEFEAYFASQHYRQEGERWFPRIGAAETAGAAPPADATAGTDDDGD